MYLARDQPQRQKFQKTFKGLRQHREPKQIKPN